MPFDEQPRGCVEHVLVGGPAGRIVLVRGRLDHRGPPRVRVRRSRFAAAPGARQRPCSLGRSRPVTSPLGRPVPVSPENTRQSIAAGIGAGFRVWPAVPEQLSAHQTAADERGLDGNLRRFAGDGQLAGAAYRPAGTAHECVAHARIATPPTGAFAECPALDEAPRRFDDFGVVDHGRV